MSAAQMSAAPNQCKIFMPFEMSIILFINLYTFLFYNVSEEANKTVNEYKFRVQKAEAESSSLQANVSVC